MANPMRGEVKVVIDQQLCVLRLTLADLAVLERDLHVTSLSTLINLMLSGPHTDVLVQTVVRQSLLSCVDGPSQDDLLGTLQKENRLPEVYTALMRASFVS